MNNPPSQRGIPPVWYVLLVLVMVPLGLAIIDKLDFTTAPNITETSIIAQSAHRVIGIAYFQNGEVPIKNAAIRLTDPLHPTVVTNSDGTFIFNQVESLRGSKHLIIEVKPADSERWVSQIVKINFVTDAVEINLGKLSFSLPAPEVSPTNQGRRSRSKANLEPEPLSVTTTRRTVVAKFPDGLIKPKSISIFPNDNTKIQQNSLSCKVWVPPGQFELRLYTDEGYWYSTFDEQSSMIASHEFHFQND